jgi:molybdopterin-guanine dinucleotide biosynthesis protein A
MKIGDQLDVFVLAGGKSSRMGCEKGIAKLNDKCMITYITDVLTTLNLPVRIIANNDDYKQFGYEVLNDVVAEKGPMGGLYTAFQYTNKPFVFILSCDIPFIHADAVSYFLNHVGEHEALAATVLDTINPLFAVYHKSLEEKTLNCISTEKFKMKDLILSSKHVLIPMDDFVEKEPLMFYNVNSKNDLEICQQQLSAEGLK